MPKARKAGQAALTPSAKPPAPPAIRKSNGQWAKGFSGRSAYDAGRARRQLNVTTIAALQEAFERGGTKAINTVMTKYPQTFLKMLVLLVPRELEVSHSGGVKALSDEQIEQTIQAIEAMMAKRAQLPGDGAKVIDAIPEEASPAPALPAPRRKRSKPDPAADPLA